MITLKYVDGGVEQSLEIMAESFAELRPVMAPYTRWMRQEIDKVFASNGNGEWAERSEAAEQRFDASKAGRISKIEAGKYNSLRGALRTEKRKAERRLAKTPRSSSKLTERRQRAVAKYEAMQLELERYASGGARGEEKGLRKFYGRVERREQRAQKKIEAVESGQLLGSIANSLSVRFDKRSWEMFSNIKWAGIHNEGGRAGNNAEIPIRTFLEWTPARIQMFAKMANEYVLARAAKAAQGTKGESK